MCSNERQVRCAPADTLEARIGVSTSASDRGSRPEARGDGSGSLASGSTNQIRHARSRMDPSGGRTVAVRRSTGSPLQRSAGAPRPPRPTPDRAAAGDGFGSLASGSTNQIRHARNGLDPSGGSPVAVRRSTESPLQRSAGAARPPRPTPDHAAAGDGSGSLASGSANRIRHARSRMDPSGGRPVAVRWPSGDRPCHPFGAVWAPRARRAPRVIALRPVTDPVRSPRDLRTRSVTRETGWTPPAAVRGPFGGRAVAVPGSTGPPLQRSAGAVRVLRATRDTGSRCGR